MDRTVLSIEDDDSAEFILQLAFREAAPEFRFFRVTHGEEGLAFLRKMGAYADAPRPDLVLLNLHMPKMSGPEVLAEMQKDEFLKDIPAVVFTSAQLDRHRARCIALGAKDFISKPSTFDGVLQAVRGVCRYAGGLPA